MNNIELRRKILETLYKAQEEGADYKRLSPRLLIPFGIDESSGIPNQKLVNQLNYLVDKGYLSVGWASMNKITLLALTTDGIDLLDDSSEFNREFPTQSISIVGDNNIIGNNNTLNNVVKNIESSELDKESKEAMITFFEEIQKSKGKSKLKKALETFIFPLGRETLIEFIKYTYLS